MEICDILKNLNSQKRQRLLGNKIINLHLLDFWFCLFCKNLRRAINIKKVKVLRTLYGPLPLLPTFYFVKPKLLALPPPPKVSKNCTLNGVLIFMACITISTLVVCLFVNRLVTEKICSSPCSSP